jgi:hypothetical protein
MSDTFTREERRSALDEFATQVRDEDENLGQLTIIQPPADAVLPARKIEVLRDERRIFERLKALAAAAGEDWYYRWPVTDRRKGTRTYVEGPSIKMANDLARIYGNCRVWATEQDLGTYWVFHGCFVDLETGFNLMRPFRQRKSGSKLGGDDAERRLDMAYQIGVSKAERNVVINALQTYADFALEEAKNSLVDKIGKNLDSWRTRAVERTSAHVDIKRVEAVIGRAVRDWLAPDVARVIAMMKAVQDGMATLAETFPPLDGSDPQQAAESALDQFSQSSDAGSVNVPSTEGPAEPSEESSHVHPSQAAPIAGEVPQASPAVDLQLFRKAIDAAMATATDKQVPEQSERVGNILEQQPGWAEQLPADFAKELVMTAVKVAKGQLKETGARRYLEAQVPRE